MQAERAYGQREHISNKSIHMYYNQQEHLQWEDVGTESIYAMKAWKHWEHVGSESLDDMQAARY